MSEELRQAYELIRDEDDWCQGKLSQTLLNGHTQRCAAGAVNAVDVSGTEKRRLDEVAKELFPFSGAWASLNEMHGHAYTGDFGHVVYVNDQLGHAEVCAVFEKVLAEQGLLA